MIKDNKLPSPRTLSPYEILKKKRDNIELSRDELVALINGYVDGSVPDYLMSAFLMSVFFNGMTSRETAELTDVYVDSGITLDFPEAKGYLVDKHSSGGVGDKVSLILAPIAAVCGLSVPMLSGRGLGHTGGTLDKLESIPGFRTTLTDEEFVFIVERVGLAIAAQSERLTPADGKIYALRDVTATVESIPLIVASIMSKKIAEGTKALILDVKVGNGAFMKTDDDAKKLAKALISVGSHHGVYTEALLTDMSQPLGRYVGNALEVKESIEFLRGENISPDIYNVTLSLAALMLTAGGIASSLDEGWELSEKALSSRAALEKFRAMVDAQGGNSDVADNLDILPQAREATQVIAPKDGYLGAVDTESVGEAAVLLGAGRQKIGDEIDPSVGFLVHKKLGEPVEKGEPLITIFHNVPDVDDIRERLLNAYTIYREPTVVPKLIKCRIDSRLAETEWELPR